MADYLPLYFSADAFPFVAGAAVVGGQIVELTADYTVAPTSGPSTKVVGIAAYDAAAGQRVTVYTEGVQQVTASGPIAAGDAVTSAAAGRASTFAGTTYTQVIARALRAAADGASVDVLFP